MNINPLAATASAIGGTQPIAGQSERDTFLKLLVTQLNYQDPLSPVKNEEFAAQLAQFSSLEQLQEINAKLSIPTPTNDGMFQSFGNILASTLIGKNIEAIGNNIKVQDGTELDLSYRLASAADEITVTVYDANGQIVREMTLDPQPGGEQSIQWDGKNGNGQDVPDGSYFYVVNASNQGTPVAATPYVNGRVSGITYENGVAFLSVDGRSVLLSEVTRVLEPESEKE